METPNRKKPPMTEAEKAERAKSKRLARRMVIVLAISCVVLVGLELLSRIDFQPLMDAIMGEETSSIRFEYADFEEDILKDSLYLGKNRLMAYKEGGQSTLINEDDYDQYSPAVGKMHDFFQTAIMGDLEGNNACFSEAYHEANDGPRTEPFTMQRIYDMSIELVHEINIKGTDLRRTYFIVEYRIQKNNGTFRDDVRSDGSLPQVFELLWNTKTKTCEIDAVTNLRDFPGLPTE